MKPKSWFFEKVDKIKKLLARLIKKKKVSQKLPISRRREVASLQIL